jgi:hypothetical protein
MSRDKSLPTWIRPKVHFKDFEGLSDGQYFQIFRNQWVNLKNDTLRWFRFLAVGDLGKISGRLGGTAYTKFIPDDKRSGENWM